jgi:hypothetical protein
LAVGADQWIVARIMRFQPRYVVDLYMDKPERTVNILGKTMQTDKTDFHFVLLFLRHPRA